MARLRVAEKRDVEPMRLIYAPYVENTAWSFEEEPPCEAEFMQRYSTVTKRFFWLCCEVDGRVAGYAYASAPFSRLAYARNAELSVYVNSVYHQRKIGYALQKALMELLTVQGFVNVYSIIVCGNVPSIRLAEKLGMQRCSLLRNSGYKLNGWYDVVWYEKQLNEVVSPPRPLLTPGETEPLDVERILALNAGEITV